jgi:prepilin-type N-terminal cleavage/methylation domain-containing protein
MRKGFTLVEIMIVVAIIVLLAAIAIPNLLRARVNANEAAAVAALQTISSAAQSYRSANPAYPKTLDSLYSGITPPYIDSTLGGGEKQGYKFTLDGYTNTFSAEAWPVKYETTGVRSFYVDQSGVIRWTDADSSSNAAPANSSDDVLE